MQARHPSSFTVILDKDRHTGKFLLSRVLPPPHGCNRLKHNSMRLSKLHRRVEPNRRCHSQTRSLSNTGVILAGDLSRLRRERPCARLKDAGKTLHLAPRFSGPTTRTTFGALLAGCCLVAGCLQWFFAAPVLATEMQPSPSASRPPGSADF